MSYWSKFLNARIRRRRAVAVSSAAVFGMALLAACGDGGGGGESSGLIHKPLDVTKQAKQGGVFKDGARTDVSTLDPYTLSSSEPRRQFVWSRLTRIKSGILEPSTGEIEPDVAESWEFSPDKLQMTVKLRRNARWDHRPPTNSRPVDAQDVVFSWDRLSKLGHRRGERDDDVTSRREIRWRVAAKRCREHCRSADHVLEDVAHGELGARRRSVELGLVERRDELVQQRQDLVELSAWVHGCSLGRPWETVGGQDSRFSVATVLDELGQLVVPRRFGPVAVGHALILCDSTTGPHPLSAPTLA